MKLKILLIVVTSFVIAYSQSEQVSFDKRGKIQIVDASLNKKLNLFPKYKNFIEAQVYKELDSTYTIEIAYKEKGKLLRAKEKLFKADFLEFQNKFSDPTLGMDKSGRAYFVTNVTLTSSVYGLFINSIFDVQDKETAVFGLSTTTGFLASFLYTQNHQISEAQAIFSSYGFTRGTYRGGLIGSFIFNDVNERQDYWNKIFCVGMVEGLAEGIVFYKLADYYKMSAGQAQLINSIGDFGIYNSLIAQSFYEGDNWEFRSISLYAGSVGGMVIGNLMSKSHNYTRGDVYFLDNFGSLGYLTGGLIPVYSDNPSKETVSLPLILGNILGLTIGHRFTKDVDFTTGQGILTNVSTNVGCIAGLGLGALADVSSPRIAYTTTLLGGIGGLILSYNLLKDEATPLDSKDVAISFNINPYSNENQEIGFAPSFNFRLKL